MFIGTNPIILDSSGAAHGSPETMVVGIGIGLVIITIMLLTAFVFRNY